MDWSDERYVRLYTRDTTNWKRLGWDGQCVLMAVLRKVDRAGTLDLGGIEPWEAVMLHIGCSEDVARRGVDAMLKPGLEVAKVIGGRLVLPNFIEAQECTKSDKLRSKELRERKARGDIELPGSPSQNVTVESRGVSAPTQSVSQPSQLDQTRPPASRDATPRHSVPCCAVPSSAVPCRAEDLRPAAAEPPPGVRILELEARYREGVCAAARQACALSRRNGKMADSVWLTTLEALAAHETAHAEGALETFAARYADGEKDERYLLGICRGNAKGGRTGGNASASARPRASPGTSHLDFQDYPSVEEQLAKVGIGNER